MPQDNKEAYKEMYEMGQRLMDMAKAGGYDPNQESPETSMDEGSDSSMGYSSDSSSGSDKVGMALSMLGK